MAAKKKPSEAQSAVISVNRRARHDYEVLDTFEAGLVLTGTEVKSLRTGHGNLTDGYAIFRGDEMFLINASIAPYAAGGPFNHEERRSRKLLMHKKEILKLRQKCETQGLTLVPLKLYWKNGHVKLEVALARGKKSVDKRASIKERDWERQKARLLRG